MKKMVALSIVCMFVLATTGCRTVYSVDRKDSSGEDSIVFVRPDSYSILGTRSIRDYLEITYERLTILDNGFAKLQIGIRNRGGQHWWDRKGPDVQLSAVAHFYGEDKSNLPVYVGPRTTFNILRGETNHLEILCPVKNVKGYQVVLSEK